MAEGLATTLFGSAVAVVPVFAQYLPKRLEPTLEWMARLLHCRDGRAELVAEYDRRAPMNRPHFRQLPEEPTLTGGASRSSVPGRGGPGLVRAARRAGCVRVEGVFEGWSGWRCWWRSPCPCRPARPGRAISPRPTAATRRPRSF